MTARTWRDDYLPKTQPRSISHALELLKVDYVDKRSEHDYRPTQLVARCPFPDHKDRKPSCSIHSETGLWYCFGCGKGGNLTQLVARVGRAPKFLVERWLAGVDWEPCRPYQPQPEPEYNYRADEWFTETFPPPPAWALEERGIDKEVADELCIRWYDEDDEWILPIRHPDNFRLIGWQIKSQGGRKFVKTLDGTPKSRTLFGIELLEPGTPAILVEDALDVAVVMSAGYSGAVASFGAAVSDQQIRLLADRASDLLIAFDNDEAGDRGAERVVASPRMTGKRLYQFNYWEAAATAKDPGEMSDRQIRDGVRLAKAVPKFG